MEAWRSRSKRSASVLAVGLAVGAARAAHAAPTPPITTNDYGVEIFQGPLIAPSRVSGLAGATTAAAEAVEGVYNNAAAPAVREPFSLRWFDYEPSVGIAFPGAYGGTDFANRGEKGDPALVERTNRFLYLNGGAQLQFGQFGMTVLADVLQYDVSGVGGGNGVGLTIGRGHAVAAYGFLKNQLVVGGGLRLGLVHVSERGPAGARLTMLGASPELGVVVKPDELPWRLGFTARGPVDGEALPGGSVATDAFGVERAGSFVLPSRITLPWEIEAGVAYQFGPRPLNPSWIEPRKDDEAFVLEITRARERRDYRHRLELARLSTASPEERAARDLYAADLRREEAAERALEDAEIAERTQRGYLRRKARYLNWPRERILLLASLLVVGASHDAVAVEGFLDQRREFVGQSLAFAPRFAAESEVVANLLRLRSGIYFEPSRFEDGTKRQHFTFGGDLRLFTWDAFGLIQDTTLRLSTFLDLAPRFVNFGFGIGVWH